MSQYDAHSISRATSLSRKSTVASRNKSLISKQTAPHELKPSDILIERFNGWKHITKQLIAYFEGIADIEYNTAKELTKLGGVIQVPFREGSQFLGENGIQDIYYGIRDKTRVIADHHANLAKTVEGSIVQHLQKLRAEIKAHVKNIQQDTGKLANSVAREREMSTKMIADLARSITLLKNTPMSVTAREDPYSTNVAVAKQLQRQVNEENALQKSIVIMQQNSAHFEEGIVRSIQSAWQTFDEWSGRMSAQVQDTWLGLGVHMRSLQPNSEWIAFAARSDHLIDPDTPLRNPETIEYPGKEDPSVIPVHQGILERKKRFTKSYKESFYVLTPSGYLHEMTSSDPTKSGAPALSLFLPECTLGAPSTMASKSHKWHITAGSPQKGIQKALGRGEHAYTFRARSHDEMMEWWNDIKQLSKVYLTTSEQMDRSGPVPAAVRSAGYVSASDEEDEEEDGSSVEEEEDEDEYEEAGDESATANTHANASAAPALGAEATSATPTSGNAAGSGEDVPGYSAPGKSSGIEIGNNGYATEKKGESAVSGTPAGEPSQDASKGKAAESTTD